MAYTINLTDGTVFATIADGTINTSSSMTLVGKNYAGYGEFLDENFIHLLENSSNSTAPAAPLTGQLWYDSTNSLLKVYGGSSWKNISSATASSSQPTGNVTGDLWYNTTNQQLYVWTGAAWLLVGPAYSSAQGQSGAIPLSINDTSGNAHIVTGMYANTSLVSITNPESSFVPASPYSTAFPIIYKGTTVWNTGVQSGNIATSGTFTVSSGGNTTLTVTNTGATVTGFASATGNITGSYFFGNGSQLSGISVSGSNPVNTTGNITGGNILTGGMVSATGNITGNYFFGNGSQLTGISISTNTIYNGTSNVTIGASGGNANISIGGTGNVAVFTTGGLTVTGNVGADFYTGNGSLLTGVVATGIGTLSSLSVTGAIVTGSLSTTGNITFGNAINAGGNGVGNIGSSTGYFNTVFAKATSAQYADLAERFAADEYLEAGTVVELGGVAEITIAKQELSEDVFGVISTQAAYLMNGAAGEDHTHPPVAMTGRVPVKVQGTVRKGQRLVSAGNGIARAAQPGEATPFNVIGRALAHKNTIGIDVIEAIVTIKN